MRSVIIHVEVNFGANQSTWGVGAVMDYSTMQIGVQRERCTVIVRVFNKVEMSGLFSWSNEQKASDRKCKKNMMWGGMTDTY